MATIFHSQALVRLGGRFIASFAASLSGLLNVVILWLEVSRERRHLARLDDRLLNDIGLTRADIEPEIAKPFWRV